MNMLKGNKYAVIFLISALLSVLQIFMPLFIPNSSGNAFALIFPVQALTEEVSSISLCEIAIYALYTAGILSMAGIVHKKHSKAFELTGLFLLLISVIWGIWRMYNIYGRIPEFGSRVSTPFYFGTLWIVLLIVDAAIGHRVYPLNFIALLIYAFLNVGAAIAALISEIAEGGNEMRTILIQMPSFFRDASFSIALAFSIKARRI